MYLNDSNTSIYAQFKLVLEEVVRKDKHMFSFWKVWWTNKNMQRMNDNAESRNV
jgi:hypothetical protein